MSGEAVTEARLDPSCCHGDCSQLGILEVSYSAAMGIKASKKKRRGGGGKKRKPYHNTRN